VLADSRICSLVGAHSNPVHPFVEDVPPATSSVDYKYVRSSVGMTDEKDLTHFWEIGQSLVQIHHSARPGSLTDLVPFAGGGRGLVNLLDVALTADSIPNTLVVLVLDLSRVRQTPLRLVSCADDTWCADEPHCQRCFVLDRSLASASVSAEGAEP
jgi:hypothetical protein